MLLVSSATFHKAGKALLKDKNSDSQKWLFLTAFLGIIFLICQLFEYFHLPVENWEGEAPLVEEPYGYGKEISEQK